MSTISEVRDRSAELARHVKESKVADATTDELFATDIQPVVEGFRGNLPTIVLITADVDRDQALKAAAIAAIGFGCDQIAMTNEGWHPTQEYVNYNPITGKRMTNEEIGKAGHSVWAPGEMQSAVENHGAMEKGWIKESLITTVVNRAGDHSGVIQNYTISRKQNPVTGLVDCSIEWEEGFKTEEATSFGGLIVDTLVKIMNEPDVGQFMLKAGLRPDQFDLTIEEGQAHADCAVIKYLYLNQAFSGAMMLLAETETRRQIIDHSLGNHPWNRGYWNQF
jgi:hypothetical protein